MIGICPPSPLSQHTHTRARAHTHTVLSIRYAKDSANLPMNAGTRQPQRKGFVVYRVAQKESPSELS